jgi:hypothetical protein
MVSKVATNNGHTVLLKDMIQFVRSLIDFQRVKLRLQLTYDRMLASGTTNAKECSKLTTLIT